MASALCHEPMPAGSIQWVSSKDKTQVYLLHHLGPTPAYVDLFLPPHVAAPSKAPTEHGTHLNMQYVNR